MSDFSLKIIKREVGDREADLSKISEQMLSRKNPFWKALERLFLATNKFTISRKTSLSAKEFYSLFSFYDDPSGSPSIQPAIASLRLMHYVATAFGETVGNLSKEVIFITKYGKSIKPLILTDDECQHYEPPIFIGIAIESHA
mgnify:CR=1 FL=1